MSKYNVLCILSVAFISSATVGIKAESSNQDIQQKLKAHQYKNRCTRRFTPGTCLESLNSVWHFDFQTMNCTERLGCPQSYRTNRFKSFESCMSRCRPLVDLYLQILTYGEDNDTTFVLRQMPSASRFQTLIRSGGNLDPLPLAPAAPETEEAQYPGDEAVLTRVMYFDTDVMDSVDAVPTPNDPNDYFDFH